MSEYLPAFIVEPVLRQARRFSRFNDEQPPRSTLNRSLQSQDLAPTSYLSAVPDLHRFYPSNLPAVSDLQRFYPTRFWNNSLPSPPEGDEEVEEGAWQTFARNITAWASQINNFDIIPSPPLDAMQNEAMLDHDPPSSPIIAFPPLEQPLPTRPALLGDGRANSETSLNPAHELSTRSRIFSDPARGRPASDPAAHGTLPETMIRDPPLLDEGDNTYTRRDGSTQIPEDDGHQLLRQRISAVMTGSGTPEEKSRFVHRIMNESYRRTQTPPSVNKKRSLLSNSDHRPPSPMSLSSTQTPQTFFNLRHQDFAPTYAPADKDETGRETSKHELGCVHYKRNVKMQCATCEAWYTCRLCHDAVEDHVLPRRDTKYMLCMLCQTPQPASQVCRSCGVEAAYYYCPVCKLWNNDPSRSIYHCDDCGICRLGKGLGKDFFHCKTCAACMSISAESTHKCVEKSTRCDCPICGEFMFTSSRPVAFMRCGHGIHETCFHQWCNTSYKCPICSKSIANMESQFRRLDRHIEEQPMPEEYRNNRAYVFCNDCQTRSTTKYHWLGSKCAICESYNTTQLELLGPPQTPQEINDQNTRARELGLGEAGLTASQTQTPASELTSPMLETGARSRPVTRDSTGPHSPISSDSPYLLPHSPTRSARSVTPIVGSYFGTGQDRPVQRRGSYWSILSAGQPNASQEEQQQQRRTLIGTTALQHAAGQPALARTTEHDDEDMVFWGGHSPRSHDEDMHVVESAEASEDSDDDDDEDMETMDEDEEGEDDEMALFGHR